ncbi:MAG: Ig-like domain repeat protein [Bifidobacteriaceae bacterium]|nr:Ig-like domain repeat protein [Bifidobacteriaceae bacterium]
MTASSGGNGAGIGGGQGAAAGTVTINGGDVTASGSGNGAGIGGGQNAIAAGTITINGGDVTASSRNNGAGIGGGQNGAGGAVTIAGGTVTATKGSSSNRGDIGPGGNGADGTVTITGGSVKSGSGALPVPQPQDAQSNPVYLVVLTLDSAGDGATVVASQITGEPYGVQDVVTRDGGKVYAWLSDTTTAGGIVLGTNTADYSAPDTTPVGAGNGAAFTLRASPSTAAVNGGTVQMNLNGGRWRGQGWRISVRSETDGKSATAVDNGDSTVSVTGFAGTYAVHDIGQDTGITLTLDAGDPGSARLDYYQPGDGDYDLTPTTAVYDGSQQPVTVSGKTSIGQNAGTLTVYYTGTGATDYAQSTDAPISAGTYAVTVDVAEGPWAAGVKYLAAEGVAVGDYTIAKAPQSGFALTDLAGSYTYGDASFTVGTSGGLGTGAVTYEVVEGDAASVDLNSGEVTILSAGTFKIKATIAESELYEAGSVTSAPVTVAKATPRVVLTANPADGSVFGGSVVLTAVVIGAGGGAQPTGAVTFEVDGQAVTGGADLPLSGGRAEFTVTGLTTGEHSFEALYSGSADYQAETATLSGYETAKAEQAPVVITPPGTKTYGDAPFTLGIGTSGSGTGAVVFSAPANDCVDVSAAGAVRIKGAGSVVVTATKDTDADYNQASGTLTLTIEPRDIGQVSVTVTGQTTYTGAQLTPAFTVDDGTQAITDGDYTVTWGENVNVATGGSLTLRGHGNYTGGKTQAFPIGAAALSVAEAPQASSVLADEGLAGSVLSGGSVEFGGTPVTGVFAWADPAAQVTPGQEHDAVFTPDAVYGGNFAPVHLRVAVAVKDALAGGLAAAEAVAWGGVNTTTAWTDFAAAKAAANQALTDPSAAQARLDAAAAALAAALAALRVDDDSHGFEGGVSRHVIGGGDLTHLSTHDWSLHTGVVKVDGVTLTLGAQYSSAEGSTVTTLLGSYLDTLAVGEHVLEVEFSSGIAPVKDVFTVAAAATPTPTPTPGQGGNDALSTTGPVSASWLVAALAVTAAGLWLLVGSRRRAAQGQPGG